MSLDLSSEPFEALLAAPEGVDRIRKLILELAMRGRLVRQDRREEPADELLDRLRTNWNRLASAGKLRRKRKVQPVKPEEEPYVIPSTWRWVRLAELGPIIGGGTPRAADSSNFADAGHPWLTPADMRNWQHGKFISRGRRCLTNKGLESCSAQLMPIGTVVFSSRAPIGYVAIAKNHLSTNQGFKSLVPVLAELAPWIYEVLRFSAKSINDAAPSTTFKEVSASFLSCWPVPIPPLKEQQRIVAKLDQLAELCDTLEASKREEMEAREGLLKSQLRTLAQAESCNEVADIWDRIARSFRDLLTHPDHVQTLRNTILDLAVRGRLAHQDLRDETSASLLSRIDHIREQRRKRVSWKRHNKSIPDLGEPPFNLPASWCWAPAGRLMLFVTSGSRGWAKYYSDKGALFLRIGNLDYATTDLDLDDIQHVQPPEGAEGSRTRVEKGDLLISITGDTGMIGLIPEGFPEAYVNQHIALSRPAMVEQSRYIALALTAPSILSQVQGSQRGIKNSLGLRDIRSVTIPIPPLEEQRRIVRRVEELTTLCNTLEKSLAKRLKAASGLVRAVVETV